MKYIEYHYFLNMIYQYTPIGIEIIWYVESPNHQVL